MHSWRRTFAGISGGLLLVSVASIGAHATNFDDTGGCSYLNGVPGPQGSNCVSFDPTSTHVAIISVRVDEVQPRIPRMH